MNNLFLRTIVLQHRFIERFDLSSEDLEPRERVEYIKGDLDGDFASKQKALLSHQEQPPRQCSDIFCDFLSLPIVLFISWNRAVHFLIARRSISTPRKAN